MRLTNSSKTSPTPCPEAKPLVKFDQMRKDYRNPIMHPRVSLDETGARALFADGESLIIAMASEIKAIRDAGGAALAVVAGTQAKP